MPNTKYYSDKEIISLYVEKVKFGTFHRSLFILISLIAPILLILANYSVITGTTLGSVYYIPFLGIIILVTPIWVVTIFPKHFKAVREIGFRNFSRNPLLMFMATINAFKPKSNENNYIQWMRLYYLSLVGWGIFLVVFVVGPILFFNSR